VTRGTWSHHGEGPGASPPEAVCAGAEKEPGPPGAQEKPRTPRPTGDLTLQLHLLSRWCEERSEKEEVTKTIAAFLNADGGTLLVGVDDKGQVVGLEADFAVLGAGKSDWDHWLLALGQAAKKSLGAEAWATVHVSAVRREGKTVAVVACPHRNTETWHGQEDKAVFYLRCNNETQRLYPPAAARYIRQRWPLEAQPPRAERHG